MKRHLRRIVILTMAAMLTAWQYIPVQAAAIPDLESGHKGSLKVSLFRQNEEQLVYMEGVELTGYYVASLSVENGAIHYELVDGYSGNSDFAQMNASQLQETASDLAKQAEQTGKAVKTVTTDKNGEAKFTKLDLGMYLLVQTGSTDGSKDYDQQFPLLVSVPLAQEYNGEYSWLYDVLVEPKVMLSTSTSDPNPDPNPNPDDTGNPDDTENPDDSNNTGSPHKKKHNHSTDNTDITDSTTVAVESKPGFLTAVKTGDISAACLIGLGLCALTSLLLLMRFLYVFMKKRKEEQA